MQAGITDMNSPRNTVLSLLLLSSPCLLNEPMVAQEAEKAPRPDLYGDPLPPGAIARFGTTRLRHTKSRGLEDAAFSPDGKILASIGGDSCLRLWDTASGKQLQSVRLNSPASRDSVIAFSGDGKTVAVAAYREIVLCGVGGARPKVLPKQPDFIKGLAIAPDGKLLATFGYENSASLIDAATGKEVRKFKGHQKRLLSVAFSADGKTLATTGEDFTCRIWNVVDGTERRRMDTNQQEALLLALSPDGKRAAWWDEEPKIHVRDIATGKEETSFEAGEAGFSLYPRYSALSFAPDSTLQALYYSHLYDWRAGKGWRTRDYQPVSGTTACGRIAPDGKRAVLWDWDHGTALHLFDLDTGKEQAVAVGHLKPIYDVAAQPGGKLILSNSTDSTIRLWDPATSREKRRWRSEDTWHPSAFTPDGKALVFGDYEGKSCLRIVELDTGKQLRRLDTKRTRHIALSGDGKVLLAAEFERIEVWDFVNGKRVRELEEVPETQLAPLKPSSRGPWLSYEVGSLNVSPDGRLAVATFSRGVEESSVYLWDTTTGKRIPGWPREKGFKRPINFSSDGKLWAVVKPSKGEEKLVLWDLSRQEIVKQFPIPESGCGRVAFSRDGKLVALSEEYGDIVHVLDFGSTKEIARFRPHDALTSMAFSDDGSTLITGGEDTTILVWDLRSDSLRIRK
jgi:WD40 repeat protein